MIELGAGYYRPVHNHVVFETYGGAGLGKLKYRNEFGTSSANAQRFFLQPSIGLASRAFDTALSLRVCGLNYSGIPGFSANTSDRDAAQHAEYAQELRDNKSSFLVEPSLTLRGGWEYLKLQVQLGFSRNLTHPDFSQGDSYVGLGAYVTAKKSYKRTTPPASPTPSK